MHPPLLIRRAAAAARMMRAVLRQNRLRAVLAALGVFLGAMLLTSILHVLESVNLMLEQEARRLGSHVVTITAAPISFVRQNTPGSRTLEQSDDASAGGSVSETAQAAAKADALEELLEDDSDDWRTAAPPRAATLTLRDIEALAGAIPALSDAVPYILASGQASNGTLLSNCQLLGTTTSFPDLRHFHPARGRFFTAAEAGIQERVCVLGKSLAERLFPGQDPLGRTVTVDKTRLAVIGVMEEKGMDPSGLRLDEFLIMPVQTCARRISGQDHISGAWLGVRSRDNLQQLETDIDAVLGPRHHLPSGDRDYTLAFAEQVDELVTNALALIRTLGIIGSGLSFAIGTLGILSIMTLLVRSRRLEIGMRRVVGATRRKIMLQFIAEAALMSATGGALGVGFALLVCGLIAAGGILPGYFSAGIACGVLLLSVGCGILAGAHPAWQAAKTDVLQALRAE